MNILEQIKNIDEQIFQIRTKMRAMLQKDIEYLEKSLQNKRRQLAAENEWFEKNQK